MRFTFTLILSLFCFSLQANNQKAITLSPASQISVLTCDPGQELYSIFGHSAIRVKDSINQIDFVFNYGTFDFSTPNFYTKYIKGLLPYHLSVQSFQRFLYSYIDDNRSVYEQPLNIDLNERQILFEKLLINMQPENKTYLYNFLYDNCSTRVRDMVNTSQNSIRWLTEQKNLTFWNLLDEFLDQIPWASWGIHTILGNSGNQNATTWQYMFLPEYLKTELSEAETAEGKPLVSEIRPLYRATNSPYSLAWYAYPGFIFTIASILIFLIINYIKSIFVSKTLIFFLFLISGLLGILILFLGFFTLHPLTYPNWNILWACPLNIFVAFSVFYKQTPRLIRYYLTIYIGLLVAVIAILLLTYPAIPFSTFPIILIMAHLSYYMIFTESKN